MVTGRGKRPTMRDVARLAGVSPALVSIVFREAPGASAETRERVFAAADQLGYIRDERARGLRSTQQTSIGVTFEIDQPFQSAIVAALYRQAGPSHPLVLSPTGGGRTEKQAIADLVANRCGVLIVVSSERDEEYFAQLSQRIPVVAVGRVLDGAPVDWIATDEYAAMALAVDHLVGLGHRRVAHLCDRHAAGGVLRIAAFKEACTRHGITADASIVTAGETEDAGAHAAERLLEGGALPTAILAFNDRCALGAMDALARHGMRVPEDCSIVGVDDSDIARRYLVDLTSVRQDVDGMARQALQRAILRLENRSDVPIRGIVTAPTLRVRSSTGPAPAAPSA